jgi:hypothetical protein
MNAAALQQLGPLFSSCAGELVTALRPFADSGQPCDVTGWLADMTLEVIGQVANGVGGWRVAWVGGWVGR